MQKINYWGQLKHMFQGLTKEEKSWVMYDWATAAYQMTVMTALMGLYFLDSAELSGIEPYRANAYWGFGNTVVTLVSGILAPILGTLSGYQGKKKRLFNFFTFVGILSVFFLIFVPENWWWLLLGIYVVSGIGFSGAIKIYDTFLVDISPNTKMNRVSTTGQAMSYLGGGLAFILSIIAVILSEMNVIDLSLVVAYRIAFAITTMWWLLFSLPMFKNVQQKYGAPQKAGYIKESFATIWKVLKEMMHQRNLRFFLIAFFLYTDGVASIARMATNFGRIIGIDEMMLLIILLVLQFVAFPFSIIYGRMADKWGAKFAIYVAIATHLLVTMIALLMNPTRDLAFLTALFWVLAMLIGTAQGGIQALSRSYFSKIIPKEKSNEYFGIYNVFGRFASIIGTTLFSFVSIWSGQVHYGIAVIAVLFVASMIVFKFIPDDRTLQ